jgi:hypothetical protein
MSASWSLAHHSLQYLSNTICRGVVHANVGQKLFFCEKIKSLLRVILVTDNEFWTQDLRSQTMTNAIVKPLDHM